MYHPLTITCDSTGGYTTIYDTSICIGLTRDEVLGTIAAWLYKGEPQFSGVKVADIIKPSAQKLFKVAMALYNCSYEANDRKADWDALHPDAQKYWIEIAKIAHNQITSNI